MKEIEKYNSVIDYIRHLDSQNDQNSIALEYYGNKITRRDYWSYVAKYRNYFNSIGLKDGEAVAICMLNSPEYEFIFASLLENGAIASTVSKSFLNADIKRQTVERNIKTLIISIEFLPEMIDNHTFEQLDKDNSLNRIIFTTVGDFMPAEKEFEVNNKNYLTIIKQLNLPKNVEIVYPGYMKKKVESMSDLIIKDVNIMNKVATYSNTGGTTGAPKCSVHTHRAIASLLRSHDRKIYKEYNLKQNSRSLLVIPISHITSQFYALLLRRSSGANIIYNPNAFEPKALKNILINEKIDDVVLPFGLYYSITREPIEPGKLLLNTPACGGEPTPYIPTLDVNNKLHACGSNSIIIGTGSTEFGSGIMATYGMENRCNESGYFFPFASGFLLDPATDSIITEPGKRGILYANAPWQMEGYLNDPVATNEFYHFKDKNKIYGTNNDIAEIVGEHDGKPVFSMLGRISDFVLHTKDKKYYPGIKMENGRATKINFDDGDFLFDMRDVLLNIEGVMEAQPVIIPSGNDKKMGYPVINIIVNSNYDKKDILKRAYDIFNKNHKFIPVGIIFRNYFARSLSSDKREVLSLKDERCGYYYYDGNKIYSVIIEKYKDPILREVYEEELKSYDPPSPKLVYSNIKKKTN